MNKKVQLIFLVLLVILSIGVVYYLSQTTNQQARTTSTQANIRQRKNLDFCGHINVVKQTEFIKKADGSFQDIVDIDQYHAPDAYGNGLRFELKNTKNVPVTLVYNWNTDFCRGPGDSGNLHEERNNRGCWMGENGEPPDPIYNEPRERTMDFAPNETKTITLYRDSDYFVNCGSYQMDFAVSEVIVNGVPSGCNRGCTSEDGCFPSVLETRNKCPAEKPVCAGMEVTYTDPTGAKKTEVTNDYQRVIKVKGGTDFCVNKVVMSNGASVVGYHAEWDISCLLTSPATCTVAELHEKYRQIGGVKPMPFCVPASTDPTKTGQINGYAQPYDIPNTTGQCGIRVQAAAEAGPSPTPVPNAPTPTPAPNSPPSLDLKPPAATCYLEDSTVEAKGTYGSYKPENITFQVYAVKIDKSNFTAEECKTNTTPGPTCLIQESKNTSFTANLKGLPAGSYNVFGQAIDETKKPVCSSNPVTSFPVPCGRSC